ncbi:MAG TPA: hypothetical protein VK907_02340, partial [Phnomibacter sp.]|nr:hypothetical protein [Phnomibacter sp.]
LGDDNIDDQVKATDFSACAGLGFQGMKSPFSIGLRYNVGISKLGEVDGNAFDNADYSNGVLQLSLYWRLLGGGKLKK